MALAEPFASEREMARYIAGNHPRAKVFLYQDYEKLASLPFYLARQVPVVDSASNDLAFGMKLSPDSENFLTASAFAQIRNTRPVVLVVHRHRLRDLLLSPAGAGLAGRVVPMSIMRKKIAEHMIASRRTSAHVHSVFEVNFTRVAQIRQAKKAEYELAGAKLTYLSFIIKAVVDALRAVPVVNASIDGDNIVYHPDVNLGIAVALDWGLIVPVIKKADERNLLGLSRAVVDLAARARARQLKPDEVTGGTFTITNPGVFGALFGMPIISQPQVAILGIGHIEKRPVVIDDAIAIRPMAYLTLGYDHRLIDGAIADQFLSHVKHKLENWDPTQA